MVTPVDACALQNDAESHLCAVHMICRPGRTNIKRQTNIKQQQQQIGSKESTKQAPPNIRLEEPECLRRKTRMCVTSLHHSCVIDHVFVAESRWNKLACLDCWRNVIIDHLTSKFTPLVIVHRQVLLDSRDAQLLGDLNGPIEIQPYKAGGNIKYGPVSCTCV